MKNDKQKNETDLDRIKMTDESARDMTEPVTACLNIIVFFIVGVIICALICAAFDWITK